MAWHPYVREMDDTLVEAGGKAVFGNDDGYLVGPANILFPALERFSVQIEEECLLRLQVDKTEVFSWEHALPAAVPQEMKRAGREVDGEWKSGFMCYGIAVGTDEYVRHMLEKKVDEVVG